MFDGQDINLEQRLVWPWWYRHYKKQQSQVGRIAWEEAENHAKMSRSSLWSEGKPIDLMK